MKNPGAAFCGIFACIFLMLFSAAHGLALIGDSSGAFGLDGSLRGIAGMVRNYDFPPLFGSHDLDSYFQTVLRLTAAGRPVKNLDYDVHLVSAYTLNTSNTSSLNSVGSGGTTGRKLRYRAWDDAWFWLERPEETGQTWLDRLNVRLSLPLADITVGRQAITFGKAYFWNPLDVFQPFDPAQFDRDYKAGVDAVRADVPLGLFSGFNLVYAAGRNVGLNGVYDGPETLDASWYGSALLGRLFTSVSGWDLAVQGGKIYGGYQIGGGLTGEAAGIEVRAEAAWFHPEDSPKLPFPYDGDLYEEYLSAVIGLGRRFENSLTLEFEFFYNDGGEDQDITLGLLRQGSNAILNAGRFLGGLTLTYEFTPLLNGQLAIIHSLSDSSSLIQPYVTLSVGNNSDLILGASIYTGNRPALDPVRGIRAGSEFGTYPDLIFTEFKWYF